MNYPAIVIANALLAKAEQNQQTLTPMKLIKLVYLAHGWYLAFTYWPLIDEPIIAKMFGPTIKSLFQHFKQYGNEAITQPAKISRLNITTQLHHDKIASAILEQVWQTYGHFTPVQLANLTHEKGSPWAITWQRIGRETTIPSDLIRKYFVRQAEKNS